MGGSQSSSFEHEYTGLVGSIKKCKYIGSVPVKLSQGADITESAIKRVLGTPAACSRAYPRCSATHNKRGACPLSVLLITGIHHRASPRPPARSLPPPPSPFPPFSLSRARCPRPSHTHTHTHTHTPPPPPRTCDTCCCEIASNQPPPPLCIVALCSTRVGSTRSDGARARGRRRYHQRGACPTRRLCVAFGPLSGDPKTRRARTARVHTHRYAVAAVRCAHGGGFYSTHGSARTPHRALTACLAGLYFCVPRQRMNSCMTTSRKSTFPRCPLQRSAMPTQACSVLFKMTKKTICSGMISSPPPHTHPLQHTHTHTRTHAHAHIHTRARAHIRTHTRRPQTAHRAPTHHTHHTATAATTPLRPCPSVSCLPFRR